MLETAKAQKTFMDTQEYKDILARHKSLVDKGEIAILEIQPAAKNDKGVPTAYGGMGVMGKIKDRYKNIVFDTANLEDRMWIPPMGATWRFDKEEDLRAIYAIYNCPLYREKCVLQGETPTKHQHRYILIDAEKQSSEYAANREQDMQYMNKFYQLKEGTIDLLCNIVSINTKASFPVKRADLCKKWEEGGAMRDKLKKMMDSDDVEYYEVAYTALREGIALENKGFYKTQNGVYKHNEEILGNSIENVIGYLKTHDDVFFALLKANEPVAVKKPK